MRSLLIIPLVVALVAACGAAACKMLGVTIHAREIVIAAIACIVATELAVVPVLLARGVTQAGLVQAAFVGTLVHLFGCVATCAVVFLGHIRLDGSFIYWMFAFYAVTLVTLVTDLVRQVNAAPVNSAPAGASTATAGKQ